jgi:hypothetical protein
MATAGGKVWVGRVISGLVGVLLLFSAVMKFMGGPQVEQGFAHLGLPASMRVPLGVLELFVAVVYLIPQTAVAGAILVAGYLGGAMLTHWRVGEPPITQTILALVAWLGIYLREARLTDLLPIRKL